MAGELQILKDAVADLKAGQAAIGTSIDLVAGDVTEGVAELHRLAGLIGGGTTDPAELATLATDIKTIADDMQAKAATLKSSADTLKAGVDEPDPVPTP